MERLGSALSTFTAFGSLAAVLAGLLAVSGLWPRRSGEVPQPVRVQASPKSAPAQPTGVTPTPAAAVAPEAERPALPAYRLCDSPQSPTDLWPVQLDNHTAAFVVWCRAGFELWALDASDVPQQLARFAATVQPLERAVPAGVARGDLDGDGLVDLVVGVGLTEGVHRPGAGVFWLRRLPSGGFAPARALLEAPVHSLQVAPLSAGGGHELVALTRGDPRANRPAQAWVFRGSAAPTRGASLTAGLQPCGAAVRDLDEDGSLDVLLCARDGLVAHFGDGDGTFSRKGTVSLPGARLLVGGGRAPGFVIDPEGVRRVGKLAPGQNPAPALWLKLDNLAVDSAEGGLRSPGVGDLDGDARDDLLAPTADGAVWARATDAAATPQGLLLVDGTVRAAGVVRSAGGAPRALVLASGVAAGPGLYAVLLPTVPWEEQGAYRLERHDVHRALLALQIPLE